MSHPMEKPVALAMLATWKARHADIEKMMNGISTTIGLEIGGPLFETVWGTFDDYTKILSRLLGDDFEWLSWHQAENQMGARGMRAGFDGNITPVKTLDDLLNLIGSSQERADT